MGVTRRSSRWGLIAGLWIGMMALRQDPWFARTPRLLFGVLPAELAYQGVLSVLVAVAMAVLVRHAWPDHLEAASDGEPGSGSRGR